MSNTSEFIFEGFEPANTTPVPDVLFDELLDKLSGSQLKVLLYIIRRTRGFKKNTDAISLTQFTRGIITKESKQLDKGCGIENRSAVVKALLSLEEKGYIVSTKEKDPLGDDATTLYSIRFKVVQNEHQGSAKQGLPVVQDKDYRSVQNGLPVVQNAHPQETVLQDTDQQETVLQESAMGASSTPAAFDANASPPSHHVADVRNMVEDNPLQEKQASLQEVTQPSSYSHQQAPGVTGESEAIGDKVSSKKASSKQETLLEAPLSEPVMDGAWNTERAVQYAEWRNGKRYRETARKKQLSAAQAMHKDDPELTLAQFKQAYDERNDDWWHEHKGLLHVEHMREKDRVHEMLDRIEAKEKRAQFLVIKPSTETNHQRAVSPNQGSALLSPEKQERNKQRLRERVAAAQAAAQQGKPSPSVQTAVN